MPKEAFPQTPPPLTIPSLPISSLSGLLGETEGLFDNIIYNWDQLLFKEKFRDPLRKAWEEIKLGFRNLTMDEGGDKFSNAGLAGNSLKLKLDTLNDAWKSFHEKGGVSRLLKGLLELIGVLFDSLSKVFPQLEAFKELIDGVKWYISQNESLSEYEALS
jgi:hypothetical protein